MHHVIVIKENECEAPNACNYICYEVCPQVRKGFKETVYKRQNGKAAINENLCIACGICVKRCPFDAIRVINLPDEMGKKLVFQYGLNSFRTYNIASPIKNKVVALIGRNGIGKTTNIKLISGELKPNFGNINVELKDSEIIQKFRGQEVQNYLTELYNKKLIIRKKPQEFSLKGKVKDIVKRNRFSILSENLMNRDDAENLSGGEMQLVKIAETLDEDADIYILDEPMNFLDISQRLKVAKIIKEKLKDKTMIIAEHDLLIIDYLADFVQILYGSDSNYGIISHLLTTRTGINNYIDGYLPNENVRFRNYKIVIKPGNPPEQYDSYISWPEFNVKLGNFILHAKQSSIPNGEIIGAIGENGIGKTTFIKSLAGIIETDVGKLDFGIRVSYKPQMIERADKTVNDALSSIKSGFNEDQNWRDIVDKLEVNKLLNKNIKNLSGGELQKIAILSTIMRDAELYMLDEPSANLDIEDRLIITDILNSFIKTNKKAAIIVDHDLTFLDSITSRIILFQGTPGKNGFVEGLLNKRDALNRMLKNSDITIRRDSETGRPRINTPGSRLDLEQKSEGEFFK